jgi:hypothetical protein
MICAKRIHFIIPILAITLAALTVAMASAGGQGSSTALAINPSDFSTTIDNPFFPLSTLGPKVFEGEEVDPDTLEVITVRVESQVLPTTNTVAGVETLVLEERTYMNGELVEVTLDYFAQHSDGTVYYFGENVDNYILGVIDNHDGTWLAGEGANMPGIIMPAAPFVGQAYAQEIAPGVAEDQGEVVSLNETVGTAAGEFTGCVKIKDTNPLEPGTEEFKFWCPGVGLARSDTVDGFEELVSYSTTDGFGTPTATPTASPDGSPSVTPSASPSPVPTASAAATGTPTAATPTPTPAAGDDDEDEDADEPGDVDDDDEDDGSDDDDDDDAGDDDDEDEGSDADDEGGDDD